MSRFWKTVKPFRPIPVILAALLFGLSLVSLAQAQTTLGSGDVAFLGIDTNFDPGGKDSFAFILLKDVSAGTQVYFTDEGWNANAGALTFVVNTGSDGIIGWTASAPLTAGTVVQLNSTDGLTFSQGSAAASIFGQVPLGLSNTKDSLIAFQASAINTTTGTVTNPVFLAGVDMNAWITTGIPTNQQSWRPGTLTDGDTSAAVTTAAAGPAAYYYNGTNPLNDSAANIRATLYNPANWSTTSYWPGTYPNYSWPAITVASAATPTFTPQNTATFTPSLVSTDTPSPTNTFFPTETFTPTETTVFTPPPADTATPTLSNSPTDSPTNSPTETSVSVSDTPTDTPTNTPSDSPTNSATNSPTRTPTSTRTLTNTRTITFTPTNSNTPGPTNTPVPTVQVCLPRPDHVVLVIFENHSSTQIMGNGNVCPYINALAAAGANMTQSFGIEHPSEPNYLDLFSGSNQGITSDVCPSGPFINPNIAQQLIAAGFTFSGYSELLPSVGSTACSAGTAPHTYQRKHNPWVDFGNVPSSVNLPYTSFQALNGHYENLPTLCWIVPEQCNDMHDCTPDVGDAWLQANLDSYYHWAMGHNSLLLVTFDEDNSASGNQIPTIFLGPMVVPGQYSTHVTHYDVLRTFEDMYGLTYAGNAVTASPITQIFDCVSTFPTWTVTSTSTATATPTASATNTASDSPTNSPTISATSTLTATATTTPSNSLTATATAGARLAPGAVVFTGFIQNGNSEFGFVSTVGLNAGQVVYFTNESYSASADALVNFTGQTTQVTGGTIAEGIISYTAGSGGLSAFSQVVISKVSSALQGGAISGALTLNKNGSGHKLLAFTVPSAGVTQYLAGLIFGPDSWLPNATAPTTFFDSNLPPGLDSTTSTDLSNLWNGDGFTGSSFQTGGNENAVLTCQTTLAGIAYPWNWNADAVAKTALEIGGTLIGVTACPADNAGWSGTLPSQVVNASPSPTATSSGATATPTLTLTPPPTSTPTDSPTPTLTPTLTDTLVYTATETSTSTLTLTATITPTVNSNPGLVAFTAFLQNGNSEFGFVAPTGLAANQTVYFTNESYDATVNSGNGGLVDLTGPDPAAPGNGVTESIISYTAPATGLGSYVPVVIAWLKNDSDRLQGGTLAWVSGSGAVTNFLVLNHNGEGHKILAFTIPSAGVTQYVAALIFGPNGWQTTGSVAHYWDSYLPPGLDNTDSIDLSGVWNENGLSGFPVDGNQNAVLNSCQTTLAGIANAANWAADGNVAKGNLALDVPVAVTVCPDGSAGWTGTIPPNGASSSTTPIPTWTPTSVVTPSVGVVTRGPFLQLNTAGSVVVRWRTQVLEDSKVYYGTIQGSLVSQTTNSDSVTDHAVTVTGLSANTKYYYAVGSGAAATEAGPGTDYFFRTAPVAGTAQPVRLWAFGDEGQSSIPTNDGVVQRGTRDAYYNFTGTTPTDLIVSLGDNAYNSGFDSEFQISVFDFYNGIMRNTPFWPGIGNHETDGTAPYDYFRQFTFPVNGEAGGLASGTPNYYSYNYANIHLVELDAQLSDRSVSAPMWTWLNNDLSANTQPWIIAYWHHAPFSHGSHNSDTDPQMTDMRRNFCSLLEQYGAALVLTGHSHDYERSYFMDGFYGTSAQFNSSYEKQAGYGRPGTDGPYLKSPGSHTGTVYAVVGSTGEQNTGGTLDHAANIVNSPLAGTLVVDINGNVLNARMLGIGGTVLDNFTIQRVVASTPTATATNSASVSPSMTPTSTATHTLSSTPTNTSSPTETSTPTGTPSLTPTNSTTSSPTLTDTTTSTSTPTNTSTNSSTTTPLDTSTQTPTMTPTNSPTNTPSPTPTLTPTSTATNTPTPSPTFTFSNVPTFTQTPTTTPTLPPTSTPTSGLSLATLTPTQALSRLGKVVLAPMPLRTGDTLCLYSEKPLASSRWEIFNLMGESIATLSFNSGYSECWPTSGVAPGVYLVRMKLTYADGHTETVSKRIVIRR